ncbi:response regulator [Pseudoalteromonas tunicata]|uniref:tetratricopeptide repeat-containing response regulator n=1 Tax=Pseudoalteromonas tunicata TaxID=314281 RepID=UPI00273E8E39|nr:tetratricopeptide repeat-containing response regulator [Pseudoalteromonas tunicata]MDP5211598.1 response regulator [Pseudoalteromonas tunicata]
MAAKPLIDYQDKKILIVDDQRSFQTMLKGLLFSIGARNINFANSGESALSQCLETQFDLLFIDYNLGNGKNGRQLLEELRSKDCLAVDAIYMIVSGESTRPMVLGAVEAEPDDYLIKPFSQGLLKTRIHRVYKRKQAMKEALIALKEENYTAAIDLILAVQKEQPRYRQYCAQLLCTIYIKQKQYSLAKRLLNLEISKKRVLWALIALASIAHLNKEYNVALELCNEVLDSNRFRVEAYDIKARCLLALGETKEALKTIKQSVAISPFSFHRQHLLADIARENKAYNSLINACQSLLEMSKRSIHQDISHQLNYIRALFDAAQNSDNEPDKEHYLKETKLALRKAKTDQQLFTDTSFDTFEAMCLARLDALQGNYFDSKKSLCAVQKELEHSESELPLDLYPESIMTLLEIGEFEQAFEQLAVFKTKSDKNTDFVEAIMAEQAGNAEQKIASFDSHNKKGIEEYKKGNFSLAIEEFENALRFAPMNTGSALNLIQALLQVLQHSGSNKVELKQKCLNSFKIVEGLNLPESHFNRCKELKAEYKRINALLG